jgi:hypothetical protein
MYGTLPRPTYHQDLVRDSTKERKRATAATEQCSHLKGFFYLIAQYPLIRAEVLMKEGLTMNPCKEIEVRSSRRG